MYWSLLEDIQQIIHRNATKMGALSNKFCGEGRDYAMSSIERIPIGGIFKFQCDRQCSDCSTGSSCRPCPSCPVSWGYLRMKQEHQM